MKTNPSKPVVFVIDDDHDLCRSLKWLLESVNLSVQIFTSSINFLETFKPIPSGCILLDIRMPLMSGLQLQEQLNRRQNTLPIIFMTGHGDIPMAVRAMKAGAFDFLTKPFNDQVILEQIQKAIVQHQKNIIDDSQLHLIQERYNSLSHREHEVLELIVAGKLNKIIASELNISMKTVELHRGNVMRKMQAATAPELVKFYLSVKKEAERNSS